MGNWSNGKMVCSILENAKFESQFVGGAVRDLLIHDGYVFNSQTGVNNIEGDIDINTNATPEQVIELFKNKGFTVALAGKKFGTVIINAPNMIEPIEVTTYRSEGKYGDSRHPNEVIWETDINKDLGRRDFKCNAVAFDPFNFCLIDPFNGREDIENKIIDCVGNPIDRFQEDPLRLMRMVRLAVKLGFEIETMTYVAAEECAKEITKIPMERVKDELLKMLNLLEADKAIWMLDQIGILKYILPEVSKLKIVEQPPEHHAFNVFDHMLASLQCIALHHNEIPKEKRPLLALAVWLHDIGKEKCNAEKPHFPAHELNGAKIFEEIIAPRLKLSREETDYVKFIIAHHMDCHQFKGLNGDKAIRRWLSSLGPNVKFIDDLFYMFDADMVGTGMVHSNLDVMERLFSMNKNVKRILNEKPALTVKDLLISGQDIVDAIGVTRKEIMETNKDLGPIIGKIQKMLLEFVIDNPEGNNRNVLIDLAITIYKMKMYAR